MNNAGDLEIFENQLREVGRAIIYPRTPNLAGSFPFSIRHSRPRWQRWAIGFAILIVALASLLAVPEVRARLLEFLQIGAVRIEPSGMREEPKDKEQVYGRLVPISALGGETTLEEARLLSKFPVPLPSYPADLGLPTHVYTQIIDKDISFVILTWTATEDNDQVKLALYVIGPGVSITKGPVEQLQVVEVNGEPAAYVRGPHFLQMNTQEYYGVLVQAPALIWESGGITYRIEADLSVEELIKVAESLKTE